MLLLMIIYLIVVDIVGNDIINVVGNDIINVVENDIINVVEVCISYHSNLMIMRFNNSINLNNNYNCCYYFRYIDYNHYYNFNDYFYNYVDNYYIFMDLYCIYYCYFNYISNDSLVF
jgi:hypothetical protein